MSDLEQQQEDHEENIGNPGFFTKIFFSDYNKLMKKGYKAPLEMSDLDNLTPDYKVEHLHSKFDINWIREKQSGRCSLFWAISNTFGYKWYPSGFLKLIGDVAKFFSPFVFSKLIALISSGENRSLGFGYCTIIYVLESIASLFYNYYFKRVMIVGFCIRSALMAAIYQKALKLSPKSRQQFGDGRIVNMISTDVARIDMVTGYLHYLWSASLQITAASIILIFIFGWSAVVGLSF